MKAARHPLLRSLRPKQWTKNLVVFAPLVFSLRLGQVGDTAVSALSFALFCLISGAVYLLNDIVDRERDRLHPTKRHRPIASGQLPVRRAAAASVTCLVLGLGGAAAVSGALAAVLLAYYSLNLAYSFVLKRVVIVDVLSIALGFVLRALGGALVIEVAVSPWLLLCTLLLALFLALCKRRSELVQLPARAETRRAVLKHYSPELIDQMVAVASATTLMAYCLYTISESAVQRFGSTHLFFTTPFVLFGIFRYLYLVHQRRLGESPEQLLLEDGPLIAAIALWILSVAGILYWGLG